jgi:AraC-like DNA-binding protein
MNIRMLNTEECLALAARCHYQPAAMARELGCSLRQLERKFTATFDQTPREWLNKARASDALARLQQGESSKIVAIELGYADPSHLCQHLKAYHGTRPSDVWRMSLAGKLAGGAAKNGLLPGK